ncbi:phenylacetate-CoA oxygenase subunit PaaJ [Marinicella sp. S1101]|uniref:1,2-phenylacetyl-CoA epoxidase subunit PaaD n=1 Tax=Marinicella marina TaxID=2996016 RepID=UPI0022610120|nr:1,2-phenylacetyl-CoA epoxidase subunit PaaD [Marinicella marina]MCX7554093.1 phenylacetate-CoA oxygenase subunit PaaJ [Marinicella marina]MDJ1141214.1 phenylacetate-CoA oxygenase subunit PaaJ [Marinicella marina]
MTASDKQLNLATIEKILAAVKDPEIPVISIRDLGILQGVEITGDAVVVKIIPTYSGCPAMYAIQSDIKNALAAHHITAVKVMLVDDPIWTTDMISKKGRAAMQAYGIAPPLDVGQKTIKCPQCQSENTQCISEFGSTACKALYRCEDCLEPFDYFKCHA